MEDRWKYFLIGSLIPSLAITINLALVSLGVNLLGAKINDSKYNVLQESVSKPLGEGGLLVIAVAINDISDSISKTVQKDNPDLPPIELHDLNMSYREANSWMVVRNNIIVVFLYSDVSRILTKEELTASIFHEVGHVKLRHVNSSAHARSRDTRQEIDADIFAVSSGVRPGALISAINKLSPPGDEKDLRIEALEHYVE